MPDDAAVRRRPSATRWPPPTRSAADGPHDAGRPAGAPGGGRVPPAVAGAGARSTAWPRTPRVYPEFDAELRGGACAAETAAFVEDVVFSGERTLAHAADLRPRLRDPGAGAAVRRGAAGGTRARSRWRCPPAERAGLLTQAGLLAVHALPDQSSPVHRGKLVREQILCQPDAAAAARADGDARPRSTRAGRPASASPSTPSDPACAGCHRLMDPIGFGFEALRRHRALPRPATAARPVDDQRRDRRHPRRRRPLPGRARAGRDAWPASREVRDCAGHPVVPLRLRAAGGARATHARCARLRAAFAAAGGDLRELLVALTAHRGVPAPARAAGGGRADEARCAGASCCGRWAASGLLPLLEAGRAPGHAAGAAPRRLLVFYTPNGTIGPAVAARAAARPTSPSGASWRRSRPGDRSCWCWAAWTWRWPTPGSGRTTRAASAGC